LSSEEDLYLRVRVRASISMDTNPRRSNFSRSFFLYQI